MAQSLLRQATQKAFAPAFTLNGLVLYRLLALDERDDLAVSDRVTLDGAGRTVPVTDAQLASEAVQWWQRGAAFHDPEALRLLGMAEARGFNGKPNLTSAIAYWHDAAARGDALSRFELAHLYYQGAGVEADSEKAIALFRQAADQGLTRAALALGTVLTSKGITGDLDATRDALRLLDDVARKSPSGEERGFSHWVLGVLLSEAAPPALRDPVRGVDHFRMAMYLDYRAATLPLCRAFDTGIGVPRDPARALGCLMRLRSSDNAGVARDIARLTQSLDEAGLARAKAFHFDEVAPEFRKQYTPRSSAPPLQMTRPATAPGAAMTMPDRLWAASAASDELPTQLSRWAIIGALCAVAMLVTLHVWFNVLRIPFEMPSPSLFAPPRGGPAPLWTGAGEKPKEGWTVWYLPVLVTAFVASVTMTRLTRKRGRWSGVVDGDRRVHGHGHRCDGRLLGGAQRLYVVLPPRHDGA